MEAALVLFGALFTAATATSIGLLMLRRAAPALNSSERLPLAFVAGSAVLSLIVFLLLTLQAGYAAVFLVTGIAIIAFAYRAGVWRRDPMAGPLPRYLRWIFGTAFGVFTALYVVNAMAPEMSPDGMTYHLSFVARYLREHKLVKIPYNMYAQLSQGIEMLFVFAFAFGKHSAAALVHYTFLLATALMVLNYGRRIGMPAVGVAAALFVYTSPVAGMDGTTAYIDLGVAAVLFAVFYLLQVWDESRPVLLLVIIGLVAGFAYAAKYTAFLAVPYAMGFVAWRTRKVRPAIVVALCAAVMIVPWVAKNLMWTGNPVAPMMNRWFPNHFVHVNFEAAWTRQLRTYGITNYRDVPWQLTVGGGQLAGQIGPVFLLIPLALIALRNTHGRRLLVPAVLYTLPYAANIGARFFIPPLPFWSLAIALVFSAYPRILAAMAAVASVLCWPAVLRRYSDQYIWALEAKFPVPAALRIESVDSYIGRKNPWYLIARVIQGQTPPGARIFTLNGRPEAYISRDIAVCFQSARGETLGDMFYAAIDENQQPRLSHSLKFAPQTARKVRLVLVSSGKEPEDWMMHELRILHAGKELPRSAQWRLTAKPNPWDVQLAFDNSPVSRWRTFEPLRSGQFVEVDFGSAQMIDEVAVETTFGQKGVAMLVQVANEGEEWRLATDRIATTDLPQPGFLGRLATAEMKAWGFDYFLIDDNEWGAAHILEGPAAWGFKEIGRAWTTRLYKIDSDGPKVEPLR
jgi:hypothetical protein